MATGACGINCDICKLNINGICSTCGGGNSAEGENKARVQEKLFGSPCPILACARMNNISHCLKDCEMFPCENFETSEYPFGKDFLKMQKRRRTPENIGVEKYGFDIEVPAQHWEELQKRNTKETCSLTGATSDTPDILHVNFLSGTYQINKKKREILKKQDATWTNINDPLLSLLILVYLLNAGEQTIENDMVTFKDLKCAHFFRGPHTIRTDTLVEKFGSRPDAFLNAGKALGGIPVKRADVSFMLMAFPKVPVYYMLWAGDEDFPPEISILFDKSIDHHLPADGIWGLTLLVTDALMNA